MIATLIAAIGIASAQSWPPFPNGPNWAPCVAGSPGLTMPFCNYSLPIPDRVADMISRMTIFEKCAQTDDKMGAIARLGWSGYNWNTECLHGLGAISLTIGNVTRAPTVFAAPPGLGAAFNDSMAQAIGAAISDEIRAFSNNHGHRDYQNRPIGVSAWGPNLNIWRDPRWGRNVEVPSEDPFHSGAYGVAYTKGLQWGNDTRYVKAIGALKHYTIYSVETGRGSTYFDIALHDIEDTYLPQFKAPVVEAESLGYMCSYAAWTSYEANMTGSAAFPHSEPCCASHFFAQTKMVEEYGFQGYVQSDCGAVNNMWQGEKWVPNATMAAARALIDGMMNSNCGGGLVDNICAAIAEGLASEADLEARITRSLTLLMRAGLFDPVDIQTYTNISFDVINSDATVLLSKQAAAQSLVLLQNPAILPLVARAGLRVALIGPHAQTQAELAGNYFEDIGVGTCAGPQCIPTVEAALNAVLAPVNVTVNTVLACGDSRACPTADIPSAVTAAHAADLVILALGLDGTLEGEGNDRFNISLPGMQQPLAQAVIATGKPVVVLLFNGGTISIEVLKDVPNVAIVECFYPGNTGGTSVAETLFATDALGRFGKLPMTYYAYNFTVASDFFNMNMTDAPGRSYKYLNDSSYALWPFGYGLSYASFTLSEAPAALSLTVESLKTTMLSTSVTVTNVGKVAGDEVVFLFLNATEAIRAHSSVDPAAKKQLIAYTRVSLNAGQRLVVNFNVSMERLTTVDRLGTRHLLPGAYSLYYSRGHGPDTVVPLRIEFAPGVDTPLVVSTMNLKNTSGNKA